MSFLKFYDDEQKRWPQLHVNGIWCDQDFSGYGRRNGRGYYAEGRLGKEEALEGIKRLAANFGIRLNGKRRIRSLSDNNATPVSIRFTRGNRRSRAGRNHIILNLDWADWLTVAHEVAHNYYFRKLASSTRSGHVYHGRRMAGIVDRFAAWVVAQGWHQGTLAHELAVAGTSKAARQAERAREAASPEPIDARIARRRAQVKRLETKLKATTTRLKRARRSLAALERAAARKEAGR